MERTELQRAIEAILFAAGERVDVSRLSFALETDEDEIMAAADELCDRMAFERRGIRIFSFSISPSHENSGLISFRIDWISLQSKGLSRVFSSSLFDPRGVSVRVLVFLAAGLRDFQNKRPESRAQARLPGPSRQTEKDQASQPLF